MVSGKSFTRKKLIVLYRYQNKNKRRYGQSCKLIKQNTSYRKGESRGRRDFI